MNLNLFFLEHLTDNLVIKEPVRESTAPMDRSCSLGVNWIETQLLTSGEG